MLPLWIKVGRQGGFVGGGQGARQKSGSMMNGKAETGKKPEGKTGEKKREKGKKLGKREMTERSWWRAAAEKDGLGSMRGARRSFEESL